MCIYAYVKVQKNAFGNVVEVNLIMALLIIISIFYLGVCSEQQKSTGCVG
jgi:hypothetical protein